MTFLLLYPSHSLDEESERETEVRRKAPRRKKSSKPERVGGDGDVSSSSPKSSSVSKAPAPPTSGSSQASISSKGGKKRSELFFRDSCKVFHSLWLHQPTPKRAASPSALSQDTRTRMPLATQWEWLFIPFYPSQIHLLGKKSSHLCVLTKSRGYCVL